MSRAKNRILQVWRVETHTATGWIQIGDDFDDAATAHETFNTLPGFPKFRLVCQTTRLVAFRGVTHKEAAR